MQAWRSTAARRSSQQPVASIAGKTERVAVTVIVQRLATVAKARNDDNLDNDLGHGGGGCTTPESTLPIKSMRGRRWCGGDGGHTVG
uniref:Uncharacterized protein n=1 Tax=Oryza punctata TaxID=4537 RepID=A0A0E0KPZ3_ORYPU